MTHIRITTSHGCIEALLNTAAAPATCANYLAYIRAGAYDDGTFWRTVTTQPDNQPQQSIKIDVIQATCRADYPKHPAIAMEQTHTTGLRHRDGTLSMARFAPDSAQADFFICISDQPELDQGGQRNPDGWGFAAFGQVICGMDVVRRIQQQPVREQTLTPPVVIHSIDVV
jgi:peptidyl-prolyl cis-trans isomerase A (cyclophilin A)